MRKHVFLVLILLLVGAFLYQNNQSNQKKQAVNQNVSNVSPGAYRASSYTPRQLNNLIQKNPDKYAIIDVRTQLEYDKGHLPGAIHADYYDTEALKKAAGNKIPVTYCAFSAMRGPYAAYELWQAGFKNVHVLTGGISAWAEDIQGMDSKDPKVKTVFNHPKNIFPERSKGDYPLNKGSVEFSLVAKQFEFEPREIVVEHGQEVTLNIMSIDVTHGFSLPEFGIEEELLPGEPVTITFIADRRGDFPFVCSVICGDHHASMVGNLIVK